MRLTDSDAEVFQKRDGRMIQEYYRVGLLTVVETKCRE
jgi:hypothetical protein